MATTAPGELAIVLHTHMPYVEGFGTWPFGEEWLWEAVATSYVPLLGVLERNSSPPGAVTVSLTPVLCDQIEAPGAIERCVEFLRTVRPESHRLDMNEFAAEPALVAELDRSEALYAARAGRLAQLGGDGLLNALGAHASWTSSATHAVLPLLCTEAGIELQLATGIAAHRRRFGGAEQPWRGGFWLPECAHAPWLHTALEEAGVRATCVELTNAFGRGDARHLRPLLTDDGPVLWPIDRAMIDLAWGSGGYPSRPAYRAYDRLTPRHHRLWRNDGEPYDPSRAAEQVQSDAREFVAAVRHRVADGGVCVCAFDTELFGHWWYEGVDWLAAVIDEAAAQDLPLTSLDDALERHDPVPAPAELEPSSWGEGGDLRTWSAPGVADFAWSERYANCWRCRPATGRSSPIATGPASIPSSGLAVISRRSHAPSQAAIRWIRRCAISHRCSSGPRSAVGPAESLGLVAHTDQLCRDAADDRVVRDVLGNHGAGADHAVVASGDAAKDAGAVADPDVVTDLDVARVDALVPDRPLHLDHPMVEVDHHHAVGDDALAPDRYALVAADRALLPEHGLGADRDDALVRADLAAMPEPRPAPHLDNRVATDLELDPGAHEAQTVCLKAPAPAELEPAPAGDQRHVTPMEHVVGVREAQERHRPTV
jgi:1,4-alpha-glucan branching enzyme